MAYPQLRRAAHAPAGTTVPTAPEKQQRTMRKMPPDMEARMHELARRHNEGPLTEAEMAEYDRLIVLAETLTLEKARALAQKHDPVGYTRALAEEQRIKGRAR